MIGTFFFNTSPINPDFQSADIIPYYDFDLGGEIDNRNTPFFERLKNIGSNILDKTKDVYKNISSNNPPTQGDLLGLYGMYRQGIDPLKTTQQQRAGDRPNINHHENFGQKGLQRLEETKDFLKQAHDKNLLDLTTERDTAIARNNSGARGINTQRALNLATDVQLQKAQNDAYMNYLAQVNNVMNQEADTLNMIDHVTMDAQRQKDIEDRQDRASYYTNLQRDIANRNNMYQHVGKMLNDIKERGWNKNVYEQRGRDITFDNSGKVVNRNPQEYVPSDSLYNKLTKDQYEFFTKELLHKGYKIDGSDLIDPQGNIVDIETLMNK